MRNCQRDDHAVILVDEMRDLELIRVALTLAENGHVAFATLHPHDPAHAVDRLIGGFPGDQPPHVRVRLAATLTRMIYHRLVPRIGGGMVAAF